MRILGLTAALALALGCARVNPSAEAAHERAEAIAVGAPAPAAQLTGVSGTKLALADVLHQHAQTVVVFYRGFW